MMSEVTGLHEAPALALLARRPPQAGQADASARQGQSITAPLCAACGSLWIACGVSQPIGRPWPFPAFHAAGMRLSPVTL
ncbi:protein of unknown function [Thauera humireducens]|nr:protein of unknown function [Thauera humireducens]